MELLKQYNFSFLMDRKLNGFYVNLPYNIIEGKQTELTEKVREWLRNEECPYVLKNEDEAEDLLDDISGFLEEGYLEMPITDSESDYFLKLNSNVIIHVSATDEYHGHGDYTMNACIDGLVITENVTKEEIREAVEWIKKFQ